MANAEQLAILRQGVEGWNRWRESYHSKEIDLSYADLKKAKLRNVNLSKANLRRADLTEADLDLANLSAANLEETCLLGAQLFEVDLSKANLSGALIAITALNNANLHGALLRRAHIIDLSVFWGADLIEAKLYGATLRNAFLDDANLTSADLNGANLTQTHLDRANLGGAHIGATSFQAIDLSQTRGLEEVHHDGPSFIGLETIRLSKGLIPTIFMRGCGMSDVDIEYAKLANPDLSNEEINKILYKIYDLRTIQAIQISPLFISYSHADGKFVDRVGDSLTNRGIRYWRDIHDLKAGKMEKQIDRAMRLNPTVLLVLSEHSLNSDWVEHEVRTARQLEKELGRDTLCPVTLDDSWKSSRWLKRVMEQIREYNILDFSAWNDDRKFDGMFRRLIDGLELFYKG